MQCETRIKLPEEEFDHITSIDELFEILSDNEIKFLNETYPDLRFEDGYLYLNEGYLRKNSDHEKLPPILSKMVIKEKRSLDIKIYDQHENTAYGYRASPSGRVRKIKRTWVEEDSVIYLGLEKCKNCEFESMIDDFIIKRRVVIGSDPNTLNKIDLQCPKCKLEFSTYCR